MNNENSILSELEIPEVEASYFQRFFSNLIDWVIELLVLIIIYKLVPREIFSYLISTIKYSTYIVIFILFIMYRFMCIFLFHKTIGMMICKIKYLNNNLAPLNSMEKLIAVFANRTVKIKYYKTV